MKPSGDYTVHFADPDMYVIAFQAISMVSTLRLFRYFQWVDILQVIVPRTSAIAAAGRSDMQDEGATTCPICLSQPNAPRMTKCGHVRLFMSRFLDLNLIPTLSHSYSHTDLLLPLRSPLPQHIRPR